MLGPAGGSGPPVTGDRPGAALLRLVAVMDTLRVSCPWDARQTHESLAPHLLEECYEAIQTALLTKLDGGRLPTSSSGLNALSQKFGAVQCHAAKSLAIRVNPQFGRLDYNQLSIVPAALKLSAPPGGVPTPSSKPQLTPPC